MKIRVGKKRKRKKEKGEQSKRLNEYGRKRQCKEKEVDKRKTRIKRSKG